MQAFLFTLFTIILSFINYDHFNTHMASRLYKIKSETSTPDLKTRNSKRLYQEHMEAKFIKKREIGNMKAFFIDCIPRVCRCCKRNRYERGLLKAEK